MSTFQNNHTPITSKRPLTSRVFYNGSVQIQPTGSQTTSPRTASKRVILWPSNSPIGNPRADNALAVKSDSSALFPTGDTLQAFVMSKIKPSRKENWPVVPPFKTGLASPFSAHVAHPPPASVPEPVKPATAAAEVVPNSPPAMTGLEGTGGESSRTKKSAHGDVSVGSKPWDSSNIFRTDRQPQMTLGGFVSKVLGNATSPRHQLRADGEDGTGRNIMDQTQSFMGCLRSPSASATSGRRVPTVPRGPRFSTSYRVNNVRNADNSVSPKLRACCDHPAQEREEDLIMKSFASFRARPVSDKLSIPVKPAPRPTTVPLPSRLYSVKAPVQEVLEVRPVFRALPLNRKILEGPTFLPKLHGEHTVPNQAPKLTSERLKRRHEPKARAGADENAATNEVFEL